MSYIYERLKLADAIIRIQDIQLEGTVKSECDTFTLYASLDTNGVIRVNCEPITEMVLEVFFIVPVARTIKDNEERLAYRRVISQLTDRYGKLFNSDTRELSLLIRISGKDEKYVKRVFEELGWLEQAVENELKDYGLAHDEDSVLDIFKRVNQRTQNQPTTTMLTYIGWLSHEITCLHQERSKEKVTREQS